MTDFKYTSRQDVADKASWEGGLEEFLFGYGTSPEEMPDDELAELVREALKVAPILERIRRLLPEAQC